MITFAYKILFLLLLLPFVLLLFNRKKIEDSHAIKVPFFNDIAQLHSKSIYKKFSKLTVMKSLVWLVWAFLVIAVARPQVLGDKIPIEQENRAIILVLDASRSMLDLDFVIDNKQVTRFYAMKKIIADFIEKRKGDNIAVILFGDNAYVYAPPTDDTKTLLYLLDTAEQGIVGHNTAMGDGLGMAAKIAQDLPQENRVAILLSDGVSNTGALKDNQALELAKSIGLKVYTIAVGTSKITNFMGIQLINQSPVDEKTLKQIANETGGKFYVAQNTKELENVYNEISKQEPITNNTKFFRPVKEVFYIPLSFAFLFSVILFLFASKGNKNV